MHKCVSIVSSNFNYKRKSDEYLIGRFAVFSVENSLSHLSIHFFWSGSRLLFIYMNLTLAMSFLIQELMFETYWNAILNLRNYIPLIFCWSHKFDFTLLPNSINLKCYVFNFVFYFVYTFKIDWWILYNINCVVNVNQII